MRNFSFLLDDSGQDVVEYSLLIGFVVGVACAGIPTVITALATLWTNMNALLSNPG